MAKCRLTSLGELEDGAITRIEVDGVPLCVVRRGSAEVYAISDICSHEDIELSDGDLQDYEVECPAHGSRFDIRTGAVSGLPAEEPVAAYPVTIDGDDVYVEM